MDKQTVVFVSCVAGLSLLGLFVYRRMWLRAWGTSVTPTGCGVLLGLALTAAAITFDSPLNAIFCYVLIAIAALIYWIDDLRGLSARFRLALSFVTGSAIFLALNLVHDRFEIGQFVASCAAAGLLNVILTNIINFYDGADLNLATLVAITSLFVLFFAPDRSDLAPSAIACLAFIVPFSALNRIPRTIYLGDAGSFAFACFVTLLAVCYFRDGKVSAEIAIPLALPAFDTFYVFCIRVKEKHDLLSRNYLHLYQLLNRHFGGFIYLLPQMLNALIVVAAAESLQKCGLKNFESVALACLAVTPVLYLASRKLLLPPRKKGSLM